MLSTVQLRSNMPNPLILTATLGVAASARMPFRQSSKAAASAP